MLYFWKAKKQVKCCIEDCKEYCGLDKYMAKLIGCYKPDDPKACIKHYYEHYARCFQCKNCGVDQLLVPTYFECNCISFEITGDIKTYCLKCHTIKIQKVTKSLKYIFEE